MKKPNKFLEVEYKYEVDGSQLFEFKTFMMKTFVELGSTFMFEYIESDDVYFVDPSKPDEFLRYRYEVGKPRKELTHKKRLSKKNCFVRSENNLRVDNSEDSTVYDFCERMGYYYNFKITKLVHLYRFLDATIPFYSVIDSEGKLRHFIEIEADEALSNEISTKKCLGILDKYEQILTKSGLIKKENRILDALFDMYVKR